MLKNRSSFTAWNRKGGEVTPPAKGVRQSSGLLSSGKLKVCVLSHFWLSATPWAVVHQASLSMGFSRQEYWSGLPCPPPGDLPDPVMEPGSPALQADSFTAEPPGEAPNSGCVFLQTNSLIIIIANRNLLSFSSVPLSVYVLSNVLY